MRVIIAGSRGIEDYELVVNAIVDSGFEVTTVVCGMAQGIDMLGFAYAEANNIPILEMPADWNGLGRRAGYLRNVEMAKQADALIAIWDGSSRGTRHMIEIAQERGLEVFVFKPFEVPATINRESNTEINDSTDLEGDAINAWLASKSGKD